jgi:ubiquinone/menaquinone biosynthesis C-methylase UbiE
MVTTALHDERLAAAFDATACAYDHLVAVNPGYHRHLRRSARRLALPDVGAGLRVLDLGCGTGASTQALLRVYPGARITAVDASAGMLARARGKSWPSTVAFVHSPVETLAAAGVAGPFDAVFAAYLVRNLTDPTQGLRAVREVLRPGGRLAVHEYTLSGAVRHRLVWESVCRGVVIPAAACTSGGTGLYRYLHRSVLDFDTAPAFAGRLAGAGFEVVGVLPSGGWQRGIEHTFLARRPHEAGGSRGDEVWVAGVHEAPGKRP